MVGQRAKTLMFLGTGSDVGKSILTAAFCRILKQDGYRVAPFKAQNMALNSFITPDGGEMGRAQVVQAEAAGLEPHVDMNPILLKPTSQIGSQVIVRGKVVGNFAARDYYQYKKSLVPVVRESFERLASNYDVVVLEGAGSAVELNLKEHDLVNLAMAEMADAPCILVGDIDRGGIFAALLGSLMLLTPSEQQRIMGFIVNKLRGDAELFRSGVDILESRSGRPVLGTVPYFDDIAVAEEDSVALTKRIRDGADSSGGERLPIGVVRLPFISNYTDFDCFEQDPGVDLRYFNRPDQVFQFAAVILPGSKNTLDDLAFLQRTGLADAILAYEKAGGTVVGLCGGYQMLGRRILDPHGVESDLGELPGLGLLDMVTEMELDKITSQVEAIQLPISEDQAKDGGGIGHDGSLACGHPLSNESQDLSPEPLYGYEIHMGVSRSEGACRPLFRIIHRNGQPANHLDGLTTTDGRVWGTYVHGVFDNDAFRRSFLARLRLQCGAECEFSATADAFHFRQWKEEQYDRLAAHVRQHCRIDTIYRLLGL
ncbi:MAG TPA: cobyric acid synthase CobQ [Syntrophobacteraceae bacterium]|nr:cobyric acid synthase CobQ [Syntrophobacteraceae bacterium]HBZ56073.1 cobyric acid synthase CobQ [Syntrophobacteraceae bacterium]